MRRKCKITAVTPSNKQHQRKLINTLGQKRIIHNDDCVCTTCEDQWRIGFNRRQNAKLNKVFTIYKTSIINNIYSETARSHHLNNKYHEYLENNKCIEKGIYKSDTLGDVSYERYSTLVILEMGLNGVKCRFLIDTGAEVDALSKDWVQRFADSCTNLVDTDITIQGVNQETLLTGNQELKDAHLVLFPNATSNKFTTRTDLVVLDLDTTRFDGILGLKTLHQLGIHLKIPKLDNFAEAAMSEDSKLFSKTYSSPPKNSPINFSPNPDTDCEKLLEKISAGLEINKSIRISDWTTMKNGKIEFSLSPEQLAIAYKKKNVHNFVSLRFYEAVDNWVDECEQNGVIELNNESSPFNLPLLAVRQNNIDGSTKKVRVCVDFRPLNQFLEMDAYPIPKFQEMHEAFRGAKHFSVIDLKSGYNQVEVAENTRKFMSFTWRNKQYRFKGTPFGLNFLPSQFNRMMAHHLHGIKGVIVYIDDIIIYSKCKKEHDQAVCEVINRLNKANMRINRDKCLFGRSEVNFLGFILSHAGIAVDPDRTKRLSDYKIPTTGKELNSFLCMANFIRQHIPGFGHITAVLYDIANKTPKNLSKDTRWQIEGLPAWEKLKQVLQSPIILRYPDPNKPFTLRTDACVTGFGGYLFQEDDSGEENIIHTFSGCFKGAQQGYSIPKKELFAIVFALRHLSFYLRGTKFTLQTDAMCLSDLRNRENTDETVAKWMFEISHFDYEPEHIPGKYNVFADLLSRQSISSTLKEWKQYRGQYVDTEQIKESTLETSQPVVDPASLFHLQLPKQQSLDNTGYHETIRKRMYAYNRKQSSKQIKQKLPFNADTFTNDWKLTEKYFQLAQDRWGSHTIDTFAASHNAQLARFYTKELNAFNFSWQRENPWINPPWNLIGRVLNKINREKIDATICVPLYRHASWYPKLQEMAIDQPIPIAKSDDIFLRQGIHKCGNTPWDVTLLVRISGKPDRQTPIIDWDFEVQHALAVASQKSRQINLLAKQLITAATTGPDESKPAHINVATRSQTKALAMPRSDELRLPPIPPTLEEVLATEAPDPDELTFNVDSPAPVLHQLDGAGFQIDPSDNENDKYGREPSYSEKLSIVKRYHRLSHQSNQTLLSLLRNTGKYRWRDLPQLVELVSNYCRHCELKQRERKGYHPLRSNRSRFAGDVWVADLIVLPRYQDENNGDAYLLHIVDHWSGFNFLRALPNKEAKTIAHHMTMIMMDHGCPRKILYDNGGEFKAQAHEVMTMIANAVTVTSVPYHPQSQGSNERKHQDIRMMITELIHEQASIKDWKNTVPFVQMKMNLQINRRHGSTPFAVYFGRTHNLFNPCEAYNTALSWWDHISHYNDYIIPQLNERMNQYFDDQESAFNKANAEAIDRYEPNQLVKVRSRGQAGVADQDKLSYPWKGPFRIMDKVRGGYNLGFAWSTGDRAQIKLNINPVPPEELSNWRRLGAAKTKMDEWVVDSIDNHRDVDGERQYRVRWAGNWTPTWEPSSHVPEAFRDAYAKSLHTKKTKGKVSRKCGKQRQYPKVVRQLVSTD